MADDRLTDERLTDERSTDQGPEGLRRDGDPDGASRSEPSLPDLGALGTLRWAWRQLTSMRTALFLLVLLAVGAVPGSVFPQRGVDPTEVTRYLDEHTTAGPWLDRIGFFDVYASPWFSAVYLLLFVSLIGCVVPRTRVHLRAMRARPPRTPARLERMPEHRTTSTTAPVDEVHAAAAELLRGRRYRVDLRTDGPDGSGAGSVSSERGFLRETGNLVFHTALIGVLIAFAIGSFYGYRGQVVLTEGRGFANTLVGYDSFDPGTLVAEDDLPPFRMTFDSLESSFEMEAAGNQFAQPRDFTADVTVVDRPGDDPRTAQIKVNQPLSVDGANVYLSGNGYAPVLTVRDASGEVVFTGPTVFLPQDSFYTSTGVVKVPDVTGGSAGGGQIGLQGIFAPTWNLDPQLGPRSIFPTLADPRLFFTVWTGDLGLDDGVPESAYALDTTQMTQLTGDDGQVFSAALSPGETIELPDGRGTVTFDTVQRFAALNIRHDPSNLWALVFASLAIIGLVGSLFVPRRRIWVRAATGRVAAGDGSRTVVHVAGLARSEDPALGREVDEVLRLLRARLGETGSDGADDVGTDRHDEQAHDEQAQDETDENADGTGPR